MGSINCLTMDALTAWMEVSAAAVILNIHIVRCNYTSAMLAV